MDKVNAFRAQRERRLGGGGPLEILVTGRSAYVAEISLSMRHDIIVTLFGSILLVGGVFFVGFHRWLPLVGMGFSLLLCCLVALAAGLLIFHELNMVTIGMCAILIGLGVDFAILIFGRYQQARNEGSEHAPAIAEAVANLGRAIFFGAFTTAVGFLALLLANSGGFTQLGVLIAIGILVAGLFMTSVFFLVHPGTLTPASERLDTHVRQAVCPPDVAQPRAHPLARAPDSAHSFRARSAPATRRLIFDASTRSMEPKSSAAGHALAAIMAKMPVRWEPVLGIVRAPNEEQLHDDWQKIEAHWREPGADRRDPGVSPRPAALALSPRLMEQNRQRLGAVDFAETRRALEAAITGEGFSRETFVPGFKLLDQLEAVAHGTIPMPDWRKALPVSSSWWFLVDRYFAHDPFSRSVS